MRRFYEAPSAIQMTEPEELMLDTGEIQLHVLHWPGKGEPLVALHGLSGVAWSWARLAALMCPAYDFYAISMRGHGLSDAPESGYGLAHTSRDLGAVLDSLGLDRVHLAGESWGGKAALHFAATHPARLRSLLLADPVLPQGLNPLLTKTPSVIHAGLLAERLHFATRERFEKTGKRALYLPVWDELDRRAWEERFIRDERGGFTPRLPNRAYTEIFERAIQADIRDLIAGLDVPTLYMQPSWSIAFWPGETDEMIGRLQDIQVQRILGDHTFIASNPYAAAKAVKAYLSERSGG